MTTSLQKAIDSTPISGDFLFRLFMATLRRNIRIYCKDYYMNQQIIQVNFRYSGPDDKFESSAATIAKLFTNIPGLHWKIWLLNKEKKEAGGIYLFSDEERATEYRNSDLFAKLLANPQFGEFCVKQFSLMEAAGVVTNAPVAIHQLN